MAEYKAERLRGFEDLVNEGRKHRDALANLKTQFENKLETFKSLRDGVSCLHYTPLDFHSFTSTNIANGRIPYSSSTQAL